MFLGRGGVHLDWVFPPALSLERLRLRPDQASQFMRRGGHSPQPGFPSPYCAERFRQMIVAGCKNYTGGIPAVQHVLTKRIRGLKRLKGHPEPGSSAGGQRRVGRSNSGAVPHGCPQTPCGMYGFFVVRFFRARASPCLHLSAHLLLKHSTSFERLRPCVQPLCCRDAACR